MYYFEVGLGVERHWKSAVFTYSHESDLDAGTVVRVPFGNKRKMGVILKKVSKPSFQTKEVTEILPVTLSELNFKFMKWFKQFYATKDSEAYSQFLPSYITAYKPTTAPTTNQESYLAEHALSDAQKQAYNEIISTKKPTILHGITGAGKTRVYTHLIANTLKTGKNVLFLYPEISLTSQLVAELEKHAQVITFHSQLTNKQRSNLWIKVGSAKKPLIIAGPRSALFMPHKQLGLIIVDEAHESSYKQESDVRYNALLVAGGLAKSHQAKLVLGSATPPINETELVLKNGGSIVELREKAVKSSYGRNVRIINLQNRKAFSKHSLLSDELLHSITSNLANQKQTLVFLNRRGTAKLLICDSCGWQVDCTKCDLAMTYHHDVHEMICHTCGQREKVVTTCVTCGEGLSVKAYGSKALYEELVKLFPGAKVGRFDSDTSKQESFSENYAAIRDGGIDIIVGTQQLAKGVDLPRLKTVGILQADLSLHFPDYSSGERTFQLLSQVIGRVGRGHGEAEVFLQTYQPDNPIIKLAINEDWSVFRQQELRERLLHNFPPFVFTAKILFREKTIKKAFSEAEKAKSRIQKMKIAVTIDGPLPSFFSKRGGFYYVQLHLRSRQRSNLVRVSESMPENALIDLDPSTLL